MRTLTILKRTETAKAAVGLCAMFAMPGALAQSPSSPITTFEYDSNGNVSYVLDGLKHRTDYKYDALGRSKSEELPPPSLGENRQLTTVTRDGLGEVSSITDPRKLMTEYTNDGHGDQNDLFSPDTGKTQRTFDANGNVKTVKDARGAVTTYTYDALNRVIRDETSVSNVVTFEYDGGTTGAANAKGHLTKFTDPTGETVFAYLQSGRLERKKQKVTVAGVTSSFQTTYSYGSVGTETGKIVSMTYPSGTKLNLAYGPTGQILTLSINPMNTNGVGTNTGIIVPLLKNVRYAAHGPVVGWEWGNSTEAKPNKVDQSFDLDGRAKSYNLGNPRTTGSVRVLKYDDAGRIESFLHSNENPTQNVSKLDQLFRYDDVGRLISYVQGATTHGYKYDANGNRHELTVGASTYSNVVAANSNWLKRAAGPLPSKANQFDLSGNLTSDGTTNYTYDARGRMQSAKVGMVTVTYGYNGLGQRVIQSSTVSGASRTAITGFDEQGRIIGEYDSASGRATREFVYFNDTPVAVIEYSVQGSGASTLFASKLFYIFTDHLGTPRVVTRAIDDQIVWRWDDSDPFGMILPNNNPSGLGTFDFPLRMPGQYADRTTNLFYNYFRDYDPQTGRYVESDPIGLKGGINTYAYTAGNPLTYTDHLGLVTEVIISDSKLWSDGSQFGHVVISLNETVYSRAHSKYFTTSRADYLSRQEYRDSVGLVLNTTTSEEAKMKALLDKRVKENAPYSLYSNSCSSNVADALDLIGAETRGPWQTGDAVGPVDILNNLPKTGRVIQRNWYGKKR